MKRTSYFLKSPAKVAVGYCNFLARSRDYAKLSNLLRPIVCCVFLLALTSCDSGNNTVIDNDEIRLITLSPHLAELVYSAGAIKNLIGVTAYADFPEAVKSIQNIGDAFKLDYETIISLQPDYILTWKNGTPIATIEKLKSLNFNIIETEINTLTDIPQVIAQISDLTKTQEIAKININTFKQTLKKLKGLNKTKKSVFIETFHQPIYTVSGKHWMSEAVAICGYENIFKDLLQISAPVTLEAVISKNPETIINISKQIDPQWQKWQSIKAVKNNQIINMNPDLFSRPSMRILDGIEELCNY